MSMTNNIPPLDSNDLLAVASPLNAERIKAEQTRAMQIRNHVTDKADLLEKWLAYYRLKQAHANAELDFWDKLGG